MAYKGISILFESFCDLTGMGVNIGKTKVMVFKNGGRLSKNERWLFKHQKLECVSYYKYLGLQLSCRNIWSTAVTTLAVQGEKTSAIIHSSLRHIGDANYLIYSKVFNAMILPVLYYGAEIWGHKMYTKLENVQVHYFKRFLGVKRSAPGSAVLGDCGLNTIFTHTLLKCIKFWLKLIRLPSCRYTRKCYDMLYDLDKRGKHTWVTDIRNIICSYGFGYVWFCQEVADESIFVKKFTQRVVDIDIQNWESKIRIYDKLDTYGSFKNIFIIEPYIIHICNYKHRSIFANFRCSGHDLEIETGRKNCQRKPFMFYVQ